MREQLPGKWPAPFPLQLLHSRIQQGSTATGQSLSQIPGLSCSEDLVLRMHEPTPPSGVSTDLSSRPVLLQPCPLAPRSAWLPEHPCTTPNPTPTSSIWTSPHGVGQDIAKPEGSRARAKQTCFAGCCHQPWQSYQALVQPCYPPGCLSVGRAPVPAYKPLPLPGVHVHVWYWGAGLENSFRHPLCR